MLAKSLHYNINKATFHPGFGKRHLKCSTLNQTDHDI